MSAAGGEPSALAATVVIPARDARATVGAAVAALRDQTDAAGRPVRVIVVDDGSVDGTGEVAAAAGAEVIRGGGDGPARARNLGVAAARTELVIFTDADCTPQPGFVAALLAPFADPDVAGAKGTYLTRQRSWVARFVQVEYEERYARMARLERIDFVDTYAAAYRRAVLDAVGGFDERYRLPSTEDQELSFRVVAAGHALVFAPAARVAHLHADTLLGYARKKFKIGRFKVATLRRHPSKAARDSHTPLSLKAQVVLAPATLSAAVAAVGLSLTSPLAAPAAWAGALAGAGAFAATCAPLTLRVLRRDPAVALAAPALIAVRALALAAGLVAGVLDGALPEGSPRGAPPPPEPARP